MGVWGQRGKQRWEGRTQDFVFGQFIINIGAYRWFSGIEFTCQCRRHGFKIRKISWRRKWQLTPVLLPGKSHEQKNLAGYSLWGPKEPNTTEHACKHINISDFIWYPFFSKNSFPKMESKCLQWEIVFHRALKWSSLVTKGRTHGQGQVYWRLNVDLLIWLMLIILNPRIILRIYSH